MRSTSEKLAAEACVDWARRKFSEADCDVAATALRLVEPARSGVKTLLLSGNPISDYGVAAIADAAYYGALGGLHR